MFDNHPIFCYQILSNLTVCLLLLVPIVATGCCHFYGVKMNHAMLHVYKYVHKQMSSNNLVSNTSWMTCTIVFDGHSSKN